MVTVSRSLDSYLGGALSFSNCTMPLLQVVNPKWACTGPLLFSVPPCITPPPSCPLSLSHTHFAGIVYTCLDVVSIKQRVLMERTRVRCALCSPPNGADTERVRQCVYCSHIESLKRVFFKATLSLISEQWPKQWHVGKWRVNLIWRVWPKHRC